MLTVFLIILIPSSLCFLNFVWLAARHLSDPYLNSVLSKLDQICFSAFKLILDFELLCIQMHVCR